MLGAASTPSMPSTAYACSTAVQQRTCLSEEDSTDEALVLRWVPSSVVLGCVSMPGFVVDIWRLLGRPG